MVFYICTPIYQNVINKTVQETGYIQQGHEISTEIYILKYIKENLKRLEGVDYFILDVGSVQDMDKEIVEALETLRIMEASMKIILLATNYKAGDELLLKCFHMSIYDMILTDDFNEIHEALKYCLLEGMQYKDALRYTKAADTGTVKAAPRTEIRQLANKVMIGMAGSQVRIGITHNCIILANTLRKMGYMVALVECNNSGCFDSIQNEFGEMIFEDTFFSMNGVDFYPNANADKLSIVLGKAYNFVISDFGRYTECDRITFNKCQECILIMGSKPWEVGCVTEVFELAGEASQKYHYYFNFTQTELRKEVKEGMEGLPSIHFLEHTENPFTTNCFPDVEELLKKYLPIKTEPKKKGLFGIMGGLQKKDK